MKETQIFPNPFTIGETIQNNRRRVLEPLESPSGYPKLPVELQLKRIREELKDIKNNTVR